MRIVENIPEEGKESKEGKDGKKGKKEYLAGNSGMTMDDLERIVDADQYQYTNLGPKWDIVNGYIGGEKPGKRLTYQQILARSSASSRLPFPKTENESNKYASVCVRLDKDFLQKPLDSALKYIKLRN